MIQRIQTIWLLLASVFAFLTFKLPFYIGTNQAGVSSYELTANDNFLLILVTLAIALIAFINIFLFKSRPVQLRLSVIGIFLEALLIFLYYKQVKTFTAGSYALWAIFHAAILLFFILAARGISKDEKLVKESDRLR
jgi:hypothetical protein